MLINDILNLSTFANFSSIIINLRFQRPQKRKHIVQPLSKNIWIKTILEYWKRMKLILVRFIILLFIYLHLIKENKYAIFILLIMFIAYLIILFCKVKNKTIAFAQNINS